LLRNDAFVQLFMGVVWVAVEFGLRQFGVRGDISLRFEVGVGVEGCIDPGVLHGVLRAVLHGPRIFGFFGFLSGLRAA